jgi:DNA-binding IclR family transcriptional regulator
MERWSFLTNHGRVLLCIAHDPGVRLRDIAARVGITERSAYGIVTDLSEAGYVIKQKDGRRNRYQIHAHLPLPEAGGGTWIAHQIWRCQARRGDRAVRRTHATQHR